MKHIYSSKLLTNAISDRWEAPSSWASHPQVSICLFLKLGFIDSKKRLIGFNYRGGVSEQNITRILSLYSSGRLDLNSQIGKRIALEQVNDAFLWLQQGALTRTIIEFA